jgi:DNA-binding transcriptional MerR regulator
MLQLEVNFKSTTKKRSHMLDIGEVSSRSGLSPATLRFYESKALIKSTGRNGLRRLFPLRVIEQLEFIALARSADFTLDEIKAMQPSNEDYVVDRQKLLQKAKELDKKIKRLQAVSKSLKHVAECTAPSHRECPKFQRLLKTALNGQVARST